MNTAYSLDDILLEPQYSSIKSRLDVDIRTRVSTHYWLQAPIMTTNMSCITEKDMMVAAHSVGAGAALHRFLSVPEQCNQAREAKQAGVSPVIASIGVGDDEYRRAEQLMVYGTNVLLLDVAHAHTSMVYEQVENLQDRPVTVDLIVGNIATYDAAMQLLKRGVNGVRVGIGGGSKCITRTVTGHGVPNLTALLNVVKARDDYKKSTTAYVPVIIDGGIKNSGDIVKALYFGADVGCVGNVISATQETPGAVVMENGQPCKKYYGMASKEAQDVHRNGLKIGTAPEGVSSLVPLKGSVIPILEELIGGIRSGFTYSGAMDIEELRERGKPMYLSTASQFESKFITK